MDEFNERCERAVSELTKIARRYLNEKDEESYRRILGKIEGIKLAQDYANEMSLQNDLIAPRRTKWHKASCHCDC